jgi:hypothetical protein
MKRESFSPIVQPVTLSPPFSYDSISLDDFMEFASLCEKFDDIKLLLGDNPHYGE